MGPWRCQSIFSFDLGVNRPYFFCGSRVRQTQKDGSDYDFVVVVENSHLKGLERSRKARQVISKLGMRADIFVYTQQEFDHWKDEFSSIPETAISTGYEVSHL